MAPKTKYTVVADLLEQRIRQGDYSGASLPGAPKLATEMGVSYMTARQAVQHLIDVGVVRRASNGRLEIPAADSAAGQFRIAYISRIDMAPNNLWRGAILRAAEYYDCLIREFTCDHNADPAIFDVLDGDFDLIFIQTGLPCNPLVKEKMIRVKERVVTLFHDLTEYGIRCFDGPSPDSAEGLIRHLHGLGHRKIDCFFASDIPVRQRLIEAWRRSLAGLGCSGRLQVYLSDADQTERAYESACRLLEAERFDSGAIFCPVTSDAIQVIRALHDHGIRVPEDVSVVSFGERMLARMFIPSITVVCPESPEETALEIMEHFLKVNIQPDKLLFRTRGAETILYGESTAKPKETIQ